MEGRLEQKLNKTKQQTLALTLILTLYMQEKKKQIVRLFLELTTSNWNFISVTVY